MTFLGRRETRFHPPPGWPTPPEHWRPGPGWTPDPAWGPAPPEWKLWLTANAHPCRDSALSAVVLCVAGLLLIVGEGNFSLGNGLRMLLLVGVVPGLLTALLARRANRSWPRLRYPLTVLGFAVLATIGFTFLAFVRAVVT